MRWLDRYMAIPFKEGGRDFAGCDCLGFGLLIVAHEAKIICDELPGVYGAKPLAISRKIEREIRSGNWIKTAEGNGAALKTVAQQFDFVTMTGQIETAEGRVVKTDLHVGLALGNGYLVHIERGSGAQYIAMDDPNVFRRVTALYRNKAMIGNRASAL